MKKLLVVTLLSLVSVFGLTGFGSSNSPEKVAIDYLEAVIEGDIDDIYEEVYLIESDRAREKEVKAILTLLSENARRKSAKFGEFKSANVDEVKFDDEKKSRATVAVTLNFADKTVKEKLTLLKDKDDEWKVKVRR